MAGDFVLQVSSIAQPAPWRNGSLLTLFYTDHHHIPLPEGHKSYTLAQGFGGTFANPRGVHQLANCPRPSLLLP